MLRFVGNQKRIRMVAGDTVQIGSNDPFAISIETTCDSRNPSNQLVHVIVSSFTRVVQKVLSLVGFVRFIPGIF